MNCINTPMDISGENENDLLETLMQLINNNPGDICFYFNKID
ncbi:hypothetical protein HMPREF0208_01029 [Citrobacter koseri]|nr:hypothetical protein HMPREF3207_01428 [Citrobacter koseri]KXB45828.1 hypothetical protein HMPREF0208_01029 [Citrobacter koseri]